MSDLLLGLVGGVAVGFIGGWLLSDWCLAREIRRIVNQALMPRPRQRIKKPKLAAVGGSETKARLKEHDTQSPFDIGA